MNIEENDNMSEFDKREVMEWTRGNSELVVLREEPDSYDLSIKTKVVRDSLFMKVLHEDKEAVISRLVTNISIKNDPEFYERVSTVCPPDRKGMLRMTENLLGLMCMTKEDKAVRMLQQCIRRQQARKRKDAELRQQVRARRQLSKMTTKNNALPNSPAQKMKRAGNVGQVNVAHIGSKGSHNIVVR